MAVAKTKAKTPVKQAKASGSGSRGGVVAKPAPVAAKAGKACKPAGVAEQGAGLPDAPMPTLLPREARFVEQYLVDLNGTQAYMRAYPDANATTARSGASELLRKPAVAMAVAAGQRQLSARAQVDADEVVRRLGLMATADERELMEVRVASCRYCHGKGHRYHFTPAEFERAEAEHAKLVELDKASGDFDERGGTGYDGNKAPHPECPECFGDGIPRAVFKDTRRLSEGAALLFAGVKVTKDGFEVKTHSREAALVSMARVFGLFDDKLKLGGKVEVDATDELKQFLRDRSSRLVPVANEGDA